MPILQNELTRLAALVARWEIQKTKGRRQRAKGKRTKAKSLTSPRYTETREAVPDVGRVPVTAGRAGVLWYVVPRPAPQDTVPSGTGRHLRVRSTRQLAKSHIFTPLPNVPVHVVKAEWIRQFLTDLMRIIFILRISATIEAAVPRVTAQVPVTLPEAPTA